MIAKLLVKKILLVALLMVISSRSYAGFRSIDGYNNNVTNPNWGQTNSDLLRLTTPAYDDGISVPRGSYSGQLPSPRVISNAVASQSRSIQNSANASDWLWQWGQFIDHDIVLTDVAEQLESFNIPVPKGDPYFDPHNTGIQEIGLNRSSYNLTTGTSILNPRQQSNLISGYIDGSNIYGSDSVRASMLRNNIIGKGLLTTSTGELLPFNTTGLANAGGTSAEFFLSGDVRANEQIGLTAVHTLFVREHNRITIDLNQRISEGELVLTQKYIDSRLSLDDFLYESARKLVGAQIQKITYEEFLPILLGSTLNPYSGYDSSINPGISNEFATAAFRIGHTMLSPELKRHTADGSVAAEGNIALQDSFFNPQEIIENGIDSVLLGLCENKAQETDAMLIDGVRNFLFGPPGAGGFDLASLNIQRGREHGLQSLNDFRASWLELDPYANFVDITGGDLLLAAQLASVYESVDDVDLWVGGLAESHINNGMVGETFSLIIEDQFKRLREGDRYFYLQELTDLLVLDSSFLAIKLSDVLERNIGAASLRDNVFIYPILVPEPNTMVFAMLGFLIIFNFHTRRNEYRLLRSYGNC